MERPIIATYELDENGVEQLVHRKMSDEEFAVHRAMAEEWASRPEPEHPLIEQVKAMSPQERKQLRRLLDL